MWLGAARLLIPLVDLLNFLEDRNLIICNDHKPTLMIPPGSQTSVIDLIVVTPPVLTLGNCYTELDTFSSDHFPVVINLNILPCLRTTFKYKIKLNSLQMEVFIHKLTCIDFASILVTTDDAISQYDNFVKEIKGTLNSLFPPGSRTPKSKPMRNVSSLLGGPKNVRPR